MSVVAYRKPVRKGYQSQKVHHSSKKMMYVASDRWFLLQCPGNPCGYQIGCRWPRWSSHCARLSLPC